MEAIISSNLTPVSRDYTAGYHPMTKEQKEAAKAQNIDTYEKVEEASNQTPKKDRTALMSDKEYLKGRPAPSTPNYLVCNYRTVTGRDGSTFKVLYDSNTKTGEKYRSGYLNILAQKAAGIKPSNYSQYFSNMTSDIQSAFSTADTYKEDRGIIQRAIFSIEEEIKNNIAQGKENPTGDLQTTLTIGGEVWKLTDVLKTAQMMSGSFDEIDHTVSMDYIDYAKLGLSAANVQNYAERNLSREQSDTVKSILNSKIDCYIKRSEDSALKDREKLEKLGWRFNSTPQRAPYYKFGSWVIATNEQLRNSILSIFSSVGSKKTLSQAFSEYKQLMPPALNASGVDPADYSQVLNNHIKNLNTYYQSLPNG